MSRKGIFECAKKVTNSLKIACNFSFFAREAHIVSGAEAFATRSQFRRERK
jgi:hypothetical protein